MSTNETKWILVADDEGEIRSLIRDSLEREAFNQIAIEVVEAHDGVDALLKAGEREYACVVADLKMPRANGDQFIETMLASQLNANTPVLVISGEPDMYEGFRQTHEHIKVITKPFKPQDVSQAIIREVKHGRLDERASLHLMTPFLDGIKHMIKESLELNFEKSAPVLKKPGETVPGDIHCAMTISAGPQRSRFNLCFDKTFVTYAQEALEKKNPGQWANLDIDTVAKNLVLAIYSHGEKKISEIMGGNPPRVSNLFVIEPNSKDDQETVLRSSGAMIKNTTEHGMVCAAALKRPKAKTV